MFNGLKELNQKEASDDTIINDMSLEADTFTGILMETSDFNDDGHRKRMKLAMSRALEGGKKVYEHKREIKDKYFKGDILRTFDRMNVYEIKGRRFRVYFSTNDHAAIFNVGVVGLMPLFLGYGGLFELTTQVIADHYGVKYFVRPLEQCIIELLSGRLQRPDTGLSSEAFSQAAHLNFPDGTFYCDPVSEMAAIRENIYGILKAQIHLYQTAINMAIETTQQGLKSIDPTQFGTVDDEGNPHGRDEWEIYDEIRRYTNLHRSSVSTQ